MSTRRSSQLTIGFSSAWKQQPAWDTPVSAADIDKAFPATSRNYLSNEETTDDVFDCTNEDFLFEIVTSKVSRLNIDMDVDPNVLAGLVAAAYGVAAAASGGSDEVQTETVTATGGSRKLTVQVGANAQTTADIPYNANAAAIQAALELLSNVDTADIVVGGAAGAFTYTFSGTNFTKRDVRLIDVNTFGLTGGTSTFAETTPGVGRTHAISRISGYTLPLLTFYIGFRGSDKQPVIFKNVVVDSIRVRASAREKVTATVTLIGSGELNYAVGYSMPPCYDILPLRFGDCKMNIGGVDYIASNAAREFEYYFQNNVNPRFDGSGIYATRHERADQRPSGFNLFVLGEPDDALYNLALSRATLDVSVQCGPDGRMVKFRAPQAIVKLAPEPIRFGGDPPESEVAIVARPKKLSGDATTPTNVTAVIDAQSTLLLT
jgi:hypothetical protein